MRKVAEIIGKRLKSQSEIVMHGRFPGSDNQKTLPPGAVSPPITSYLASGNFELEGTENANWYVKDREGIQVVPADADSDASIFDWIGYRAADIWNNTARENKKDVNRVTGAFKESVSDVFADGLTWAKNLRYILLLVLAVLILTSLKDLFK